MAGKVYVASMNMRGKWADCSYIDNHIKINVTSAQGKTNLNRLSQIKSNSNLLNKLTQFGCNLPQ